MCDERRGAPVQAASQPGSPLSMPAIMPFSACGARFPGSSAKYTRLIHSTSHSACATGAPTRAPR